MAYKSKTCKVLIPGGQNSSVRRERKVSKIKEGNYVELSEANTVGRMTQAQGWVGLFQAG